MGVCYPVPNANYSGENTFLPIADAGLYLWSYEHRHVQNIGTTTILQQPKHGILRLLSETDRGTLFDSSAGPVNPADGGYVYLPEKGYVGKDTATFLVEIAGVKVKVVYFFQAWAGGLGNYGIEMLCGKKGYHWKISSTLDSNRNSTLLASANGKSVITEEFTGATLGGKNPFTFTAGEVVTVRQTRGDSSLVESDGRSWATERGVWVPTRILVSKRSFKPVSKYIGQKHITIGGGDFHADYEFDTKGRFKYQELGSSVILRGHLYQFKRIIWARINTTDEMDQLRIFVLAPDGRLLYPIY
jgi:hypothetical protein